MTAKLVVIGDSLSQGFQSGSIYNTFKSYPAMLADALNDNFNFSYPMFGASEDGKSDDGEGGLPINLEMLLRVLMNV